MLRKNALLSIGIINLKQRFLDHIEEVTHKVFCNWISITHVKRHFLKQFLDFKKGWIVK